MDDFIRGLEDDDETVKLTTNDYKIFELHTWFFKHNQSFKAFIDDLQLEEVDVNQFGEENTIYQVCDSVTLKIIEKWCYYKHTTNDDTFKLEETSSNPTRTPFGGEDKVSDVFVSKEWYETTDKWELGLIDKLIVVSKEADPPYNLLYKVFTLSDQFGNDKLCQLITDRLILYFHRNNLLSHTSIINEFKMTKFNDEQKRAMLFKTYKWD